MRAGLRGVGAFLALQNADLLAHIVAEGNWLVLPMLQHFTFFFCANCERRVCAESGSRGEVEKGCTVTNGHLKPDLKFPLLLWHMHACMCVCVSV